MTTLAIGRCAARQPIASSHACGFFTRQAIDAFGLVIANPRLTRRSEFDWMTRRGISIGTSARDIVCAFILISGTGTRATDSPGAPTHTSNTGHASGAAHSTFTASAHSRITRSARTRAAARRAFCGRFGPFGRREWIDLASIEHHNQADDAHRGQKNAIFHNLASLKLTNVRE